MVALGAQEAVAVVAQVEETFDLDEVARVGLIGVGHGVTREALATVAIAAIAATSVIGVVVGEFARLALGTGLGELTSGGALGGRECLAQGRLGRRNGRGSSRRSAVDLGLSGELSEQVLEVVFGCRHGTA